MVQLSSYLYRESANFWVTPVCLHLTQKTQSGRNLHPHSDIAKFVGMDNHTRIIGVYIPAKDTIRVLRRAEFYP